MADVVIELPLFNKDGDVMAVTKLLREDYCKVRPYKWHLSAGYAKTTVPSKGGSIGMHRLIMDVQNPRLVVDHINHDKLDNCRTNLRVVTRGANNQNRQKVKKEDGSTTSQYKGVHSRPFIKSTEWIARCGHFYRASFKNELEAAKAYDKAALHYCGVGAELNFKYTDAEINEILAQDAPKTPVFKRMLSELPKGVWLEVRTKTKPYGAKYCKKHLGFFATPEEASKAYEDFKLKYDNEKEEKHMALDITRNEQGQAIIPLRNKKKEIVNNIIVGDDDWHHLMRYTFCANKANYVSVRKKGMIQMLHRYLMNPDPDMIVDHINHNNLDNRRENLRIVNTKQSSYNKRKKQGESSSPFKGVSKVVKQYSTGITECFISSIIKDGKRYCLGTFKNELDAARAYNKKAKELFGEHGYLNVIPGDPEDLNVIPENQEVIPDPLTP